MMNIGDEKLETPALEDFTTEDKWILSAVNSLQRRSNGEHGQIRAWNCRSESI